MMSNPLIYVKVRRRVSEASKSAILQSSKLNSQRKHLLIHHHSLFTFTLDGNWSGYTPYGECSSKCGGGVQERFRYCNNPSPAYDGKNCVGFAKTVRVRTLTFVKVGFLYDYFRSASVIVKPLLH